MTSETIDWDALRRAADDVRERAYAPYSGYAVGAAAVTDDGRVVSGCNVENASYGLTLCAECGLVSSLHASGGGRLRALVCLGGPVGEPGAAVTPCGRCRQLLEENGELTMLLDTPEGVVALADLLPQAFGRQALAGSEEAR